MRYRVCYHRDSMIGRSIGDKFRPGRVSEYFLGFQPVSRHRGAAEAGHADVSRRSATRCGADYA